MKDDDVMMEIRMQLYRNGRVGVMVVADESVPECMHAVLQHGLVSACADIKEPAKKVEPK
jgi:hypothetical protein